MAGKGKRFLLRTFVGVVAFVGIATIGEHKVAAIQWGNCEDVSSSWNWATATYCGPYPYETGVFGDITNTVLSYVTAYNWGWQIELYWGGRVTPLDQDAYYSAGFTVCCY